MASEKIIGKTYEQSNINERLFAAYDAVCNVEEKLKTIEKDIKDAIPEKTDFCDIQNVTLKFNNILSSVISVQDVMTSAVNNVMSEAVAGVNGAVQNGVNYAQSKANEGIEYAQDKVNEGIEYAQDKTSKAQSKVNELIVDAQYTKYLATQIILKKFQIIKYMIEYIKLCVDMFMSKIKKKAYIAFLSGKGQGSDQTLETAMSSVATAANKANAIINVISSIVTMINNTTIMNVNGAGMAFFQTPKSIVKTDINITNPNLSTTNFIPQAIDEKIADVEQTIRKNNGVIKLSKIAAMGLAGQSSVASGSFNPGTFGSLPKFDTSVIKDSVNMILQSILSAEAMPRYEKLSVSNIRFLTFLVTGFEPAGKRTFGIPGYP